MIEAAWGRCAAELVGRFVDTLDVGDTSCAKVPAPAHDLAEAVRRAR